MNQSIEHLEPQYKRATLDAWTKLNYSRAIDFYERRLESFKSQFVSTWNQSMDSFFEQLNQIIENKWKNGIRKDYFDFVARIQAGQNVTAEIQALKNSTDFHENFKGEAIEKYLTQFKKGKGGNPQALLGNQYEKYIHSVLIGLIAGASNWSVNTINSLVQDWAKQVEMTGRQTSKSVATSRASFIRPDIIMSVTASEFSKDKKEKVLRRNGVSVELQEKIQLNDENILSILSDLSTAYNIAGLYGFSIKLWESGNNKAFMRSVPLKEELEADFNQTDSHGNKHTWEVDYVTTYMLWKISNNILNFVGPTDIGLITGRRFEPFSVWLGNHMFYMRVQLDNIVNKGTYTARPYLDSPYVYILDFIHTNQKYTYTTDVKITDAQKALGYLHIDVIPQV